MPAAGCRNGMLRLIVENQRKFGRGGGKTPPLEIQIVAIEEERVLKQTPLEFQLVALTREILRLMYSFAVRKDGLSVRTNRSRRNVHFAG